MTAENIALAGELKHVMKRFIQTDRRTERKRVNYLAWRAAVRRKTKVARLISQGYETMDNFVKARRGAMTWHGYYAKLRRSEFVGLHIKRINQRIVLVKEVV